MELKPVHYFVSAKNAHHGEAIAKGFRARKVPAERGYLEPNAQHLIGGLGHGSLPLMMAARHYAEPYIFFDRAYFGGGPGSDRLRVVPNAYQHHWVTKRASDRFRNTGVELKPWRKDGKHILLVPPAQAIRTLFGIDGWLEATTLRLKARTERPVMVSIKPDPRPLADRLRDCWCVVTWTSNVAVEAICAGVPAFVSEHSAAAPVAGVLDQIEERMDTPPMPEREAWAWSLAEGEFSIDEIASGYARSVVMP